jgi:WD40 repeat protein/predicted Ser/Thr protein kinase
LTRDAERPRAERDRLVKDLFERVLDAPPQEREAILARSRESLQRDVRAILRTEDRLGDFLEAPAARRILDAAEEARLVPGDEVADFTVVGVLGEGGGGVVYEAEQREPRRRVALKMIRARARSDDALRSFRDEAASLARLQHAAIGHVYSAGVLERDGRREPWIAMELVGGARTIVRFARDEALGRDGRLRLFVEACAALHHAHENGVIHRDVTPGNVLVDRDGRPKVVDFGVACGVADGDERSSDAVGTLAYASPEQLTAERGRIDRRADVYGLGALLYELLTGSVPLEMDDLPVADVARAKRETPVVAPGARAPGVPRDLDAIVLRALAPDREARYGSAADLAADVTRFLADEPVAAFAGGTWYQTGKFVRRRRAAALAIAGVAAALVAGAAVSVRFAVENAAERDRAERSSYVAAIAAAASALRVNDVAEARRRLDRAPTHLREWEWRHLASRLDHSVETVAVPQHELRYGSVSRDGELVAVSGSDRTAGLGRDRFAALLSRDGSIVRKWSFHADVDRRVVAVKRGDGSIVGEWESDDLSGVPPVALSPDGRRLVIGLNSGGVLACDVPDGVEHPVIAAHSAGVIAVEFSPDGSLFATAGADGAARLWSSEDRSRVRDLAGHEDRVICLAFGPAGRQIATGCRDGSIRIFDASSGETVRTLLGHEASVEGVSVSPDGARLASASRDRTVRLWSLADGGLVAVGRAHTSNVRDVEFDPRGDAYVSASWDGTLRAWDARTGAEQGSLLGHGSAVTAVAFTRRSSGAEAGGRPRLESFSRDGTIKRWKPDRTGPATFRGLRDEPVALAFDPDGTSVAVAGGDWTVSILDSRTARSSRSIDLLGHGDVLDVEFLDDRSLVVLTGSAELEVWGVPSDGGAPTCTRRLPRRGNAWSTMCVDRARASVWFAAAPEASAGSTSLPVKAALHCFDLASGAVLETRSWPSESSGAIACDGRGGVAVGGLDGVVAFSEDGAAWRTARLGASPVRSVAFDETGGRIVAASQDGGARVLRTADLSTLVVLSGHTDVVFQAEFLPGGRRIVTVSRDLTTRLWDAEDGENVLVLHEHGYPVTCLAVSPDGTRIATGAGATEDRESAVKIWAAPASAR